MLITFFIRFNRCSTQCSIKAIGNKALSVAETRVPGRTFDLRQSPLLKVTGLKLLKNSVLSNVRTFTRSLYYQIQVILSPSR